MLAKDAFASALVAALAVFVVGCSGSGSSHATPTTEATRRSAAVKTVNEDIRRLWGQFTTVIFDVGLAIRDSSPNNLDTLARAGQIEHDELDQLTLDLRSDRAAVGVHTATKGVANVVGTVVAYARRPNHATPLSDLSTRLQTVQGVWTRSVGAVFHYYGPPSYSQIGPECAAGPAGCPRPAAKR